VSLSLAAKLRLVAEILLTYAQVRATLARHQLPATVQRLRGIPGRGGLPLPDPDRDAWRLGRAVQRTLSPLPFNTLCLMQSLVLMRLLARRRATAKLIIAVRPGTALALDAHAWLELSGLPLLVPAGADYGRLLTL
jgi:hypothetical protein